MLRTLAFILCCSLVPAAGSVAAAQPPAKPAPQQPAPPRPEPGGQRINIRVELAITDQLAAGDPLKKTVTMIAADGARSSIRNASPEGLLNVDAQPSLAQAGAIRLGLALEYKPAVAATGSDGVRALSRIEEQLTVMLESGKPLVISQSADPASDRKVTVQVTATVLK